MSFCRHPSVPPRRSSAIRCPVHPFPVSEGLRVMGWGHPIVKPATPIVIQPDLVLKPAALVRREPTIRPITPGAKFSTNTSNFGSIESMSSRAPRPFHVDHEAELAVVVLHVEGAVAALLFLEWLKPASRIRAPRGASSSLRTSAPNSAIRRVQVGPPQIG